MLYIFRWSETEKADEAYFFCFFRLDTCGMRWYSLN